MRLYYYKFDGRYFDGQVIILAKTRYQADQLAKEKVEKDLESLEFLCSLPISENIVVYFNDSDH